MIRVVRKRWMIALVVAFALTVPAAACLTFFMERDGESVYGRNFDWSVGIGAVFVNPRHVKKIAFTTPGVASIAWTSKFGSVTFNQFSKDIPVGGMNEKGLVIECLVSRARHPQVGTNKAITELQWIQYHLDTCKSVDDVIQSAKKIHISKYAVSLHYFVSDAAGNSAVIEFLDGAMVHRTGKTLPVKVLANSPYDLAVKTAGGRSRFARARGGITAYDGKKKLVPYAYDVLDNVAQGDFTKWQVVYDVKRRIIHFRTEKSKGIKTVDVSKLAFERLAKPLMLDVNLRGKGDVRDKFEPYTVKKNYALMNSSLAALKKSGLMLGINKEHVDFISAVVNSYRYAKPTAVE